MPEPMRHGKPAERKLGIGPLVRRAFGRHERRISEIYRRAFIDLDALVASIRGSVNAPAEILEIGCGDGLMTERIALAFPASSVTGIDICNQPGRLYRGARARVRFLRISLEELSEAECARYQLVIISDVLHHVPHREWQRFLGSAATFLADGGTLILKDWVRELTPAYMFGFLSDRLVTADRIRYAHESELKALAYATFGADAIRLEFRIKPWHCNLALVISPKTRASVNGDGQG